ncbi:helix-turn-helix domain-containing protein [Parablastomonas sp. CN1-191]|uniref:helix-turn-helix domain-containing protein n=1 Tax=Parablastomonas sp. CN1-191 TaxID=3400908 RepID=UPI003BF840B1
MSGLAPDAASVRDRPLTSQALFQLDYVAPTPATLPFVTTFFRTRCDEADIVDIQPASVGVLAVFVRGTGAVHFADGRSMPSHKVVLGTPMRAAAGIAIKGPWHTFGAALSPAGWACLTGMDAARHSDSMYDAAAIHPAFAELGDAVGAVFDTASAEDLALLFERAMLAVARPLPAGHDRLIAAVKDWLGASLSPPLDDLYARSGFSPRQTQRLVLRYYGLAPKALARKYRALRAAALLVDPNLPDAAVPAIAGHFYDQSHMIREIRLFAGRTPARLGDGDQPYLSALLDHRSWSGGRPRVAPIPDDLNA